MTFLIKVPSGIAMLIALFVATTPTNAQVVDSTKTEGWEVKTIYSRILGEKRKINIRVPQGINKYDVYPVLYLLDGEAQTAMVTGQVQYLSEAYKIIPKLVVVSIENTDRFRDLTPTHSIIGPNGKADTSANAIGKTSGGGEKFLQFIKEELMPYIETSYPTAPYRILSGHSLGALMAVYCMVNHPGYFNAYIAISPSLQWDNEIMLKQVSEKNDAKNTTSNIFFFSDANEDAAFHQNQIKLDSLLKLKNIPGLKYKRLFYPEETHISEPVKASYDGIRFIYPNWHLAYNSSAFRKIMTSKMIKDHFNELSKVYGYHVLPLHDDINQISRFLRNDPNRIKDAVELLQMNATNYPASALVQETLGDTYVKAGDTKNALASFQKALLLDPAVKSVPLKIKNLQQP
jgi:predicted alpha/beta superfamily hydrolase